MSTSASIVPFHAAKVRSLSTARALSSHRRVPQVSGLDPTALDELLAAGIRRRGEIA